MFRYIVALLLVSLYSKSSGAPTSGSSTDLSTLLTNLARTCENQFLRTQITSKVNDCHVLVPPYDEKKFQCMLFYDINKQLCAAVDANKLALTEDYTAHIQKEQDVSKLCTAAKDWSFTELGEVYKKYVSVVFNNSIRCARVCSVDNDDILNVESNFYCKYLKWGSEMLKSQVVIASQAGTTVDALVHLPAKKADAVTKNPEPLPVETNAHSGPDVHVKDPVVIPKPLAPANTDASHVPAADPASSTPIKINPETAGNVETGPELPIPQLPVSGVAPDPNPVKVDSNKDVVDPNSAVSSEGTQNKPVNEIEPEKPPKTTSDSNKNNAKPKESETNAEPKKVEPPINSPNSQVDKPNPNDIADPDEYQNDIDSEEVRGGLTDNQGGDDGDDGSLGDELKVDKDKINENKKSDTPMSQFNVNDISQKEYYPSDAFTEDDDHFFSFFLTAVVMVIILYILYHNKSKVSKVIMGLIVEGRQTGRRRNSRGHAYKRLDTLEQAMSTNTAAPPSKIIY